MVFSIQMVLPFVIQQITNLPLQNVIDFIKSIYMENDNYIWRLTTVIKRVIFVFLA